MNHNPQVDFEIRQAISHRTLVKLYMAYKASFIWASC